MKVILLYSLFFIISQTFSVTMCIASDDRDLYQKTKLQLRECTSTFLSMCLILNISSEALFIFAIQYRILAVATTVHELVILCEGKPSYSKHGMLEHQTNFKIQVHHFSENRNMAFILLHNMWANILCSYSKTKNHAWLVSLEWLRRFPKV